MKTNSILNIVNYIFFLVLLTTSFGWSQSFDKAKSFYDDGRINLSKNELYSLLKSHPKHEEALVLLAKIYAEQEDWEAVSKHYKTLLEIQPDNPEYNYKYGGSLGLYAKTVNKFKAVFLVEDVKKHLNKAADLDPSHIEVRWALIQLYLELPTVIGGSVQKAKEYAKELEDVSPVDGALTNGLIAEEEENYNQAELYYKEAIAIGNSKLTYQKLLDLYLKTNQFQKAKKIAQEAYNETSEVLFLEQVQHLN